MDMFNKLVVNRQQTERLILLNAHKYNMMSKMLEASVECDYLGADFDNKTDKLNDIMQEYLKHYNIGDSKDVKYLKGCMYTYLVYNFTGDFVDAH